MKQILFLILVFLLSFTSCKKDASNPVSTDTIPSPPTLSTPKDTASNVAVPVVLTWNESSGAKAYTLQVSTSSSFTSFVFNKIDITTTTQQIPDLIYSAVYYWRVNVTNSAGTSDWSKVWSFTTIFIPGISTVNYEGKTYHTVQIGTQCWLKENLDVGTMIQAGDNPRNNSTIEKYCYGNNEANCTTNGGFYKWNEAMQYVTMEGAKGICPTGWHIPTQAEFIKLGVAVGNNSSALRKNGTNTSGFSALITGSRDDNGEFRYFEGKTYFWSSTEEDYTSVPYRLNLHFTDNGMAVEGTNKDYGFSVRCIKD